MVSEESLSCFIVEGGMGVYQNWKLLVKKGPSNENWDLPKIKRFYTADIIFDLETKFQAIWSLLRPFWGGLGISLVDYGHFAGYLPQKLNILAIIGPNDPIFGHLA